MPGAATQLLLLLLSLSLLLGSSHSSGVCYDATQPSLAEHFNAASVLVRICQAFGDVGANSSTCHEGCVQSLVQVRQSDCFRRLLTSGQVCEDVLGLILSVLSLKKVGLPGCRPRIKYICSQDVTSSSLPWHSILALIAGGAAVCAVAMYAAVYYADKYGFHHYEGDDDWRHLGSPSPSDTPTELRA
eukprot:GGOE01020163.1.p2 GENE.GGOE01020163.1~~GGOE01020163.1.p2  ORF type:complete len:206 (+),score=63.24 GGOE01020163.1:58-618(+)